MPVPPATGLQPLTLAQLRNTRLTRYHPVAHRQEGGHFVFIYLLTAIFLARLFSIVISWRSFSCPKHKVSLLKMLKITKSQTFYYAKLLCTVILQNAYEPPLVFHMALPSTPKIANQTMAGKAIDFYLSALTFRFQEPSLLQVRKMYAKKRLFF
jgi:hypothetical protein